MARTGVSIQVSNTSFGSPPNVDANAMLVIAGATATTGGTMAFSLDTPYLLRSVNDLDTLGITEANNPDVYKQVNDAYARNSGLLLWIVGVASNAAIIGNLLPWLRATVVNGFEFRPRQVGLSAVADSESADDLPTKTAIQTQIDAAYVEGFAIVVVEGRGYFSTEINTAATTLPDLSTEDCPFIGQVIVTNVQGGRPCVGDLIGFMSTLSVGTSIGDASPQFTIGSGYYFCDSADGTIASAINTPCVEASYSTVNTLGDKQYIFARTRPPRNGLWWNDGATAADKDTALSTLEAVRVIASMVDALREYFTPYINNRIPVNNSGDIRGDYKEVVLGGAREKVITPYEENGDISGASLDMRAENNDMVGTRTWEVTLGILGAPTLRWINGYASYVRSL